MEDLAEMQQALNDLARTGTGVGAPALLLTLAEGSWKVGHHDDALGALDLATALAAEQGQNNLGVETLRLRGAILLDKDEGQAEEAERLFLEATELAHRQGAKLWELVTATSLARLWQSEGKTTEARELLQPVHAWFTEGFDTQNLKDAKALLEELA